MQNSEKDKTSIDRKSGGRLKKLLIIALLIALSMVFKRLSITAGPFRFSFENLPLILSGMIFGPVAGFMTGAVGDILGCIISGFAINPIITAGAAIIGCVPGIVSFYCFKDRPTLKIIVGVALAHLIGSIIIKSIGLHVYYNHPWSALALRIPLYIITGAVEGYIIRLLMKNKAFARLINKIR